MILTNGRHAIHEVYYVEEGKLWACTEDPVYLAGDTGDELREVLEHCQRSLERPALEYADLVPDHEPPDPDVDLPF